MGLWSVTFIYILVWSIRRFLLLKFHVLFSSFPFFSLFASSVVFDMYCVLNSHIYFRLIRFPNSFVFLLLYHHAFFLLLRSVFILLVVTFALKKRKKKRCSVNMHTIYFFMWVSLYYYSSVYLSNYFPLLFSPFWTIICSI